MQLPVGILLKALEVALEVVKLKFQGKLDFTSFFEAVYKGFEAAVRDEGHMSMDEFEDFLWKEIKHAFGR